MTDAIEKLIEAAEKTVAGTYLDEMRPLRIAIAPARAEWERMRADKERLRQEVAQWYNSAAIADAELAAARAALEAEKERGT